ncbi:MAG: acetylxylan esterase [Chloroflexi bacterium]|nr:acetylxylan esterase [Chloroflexota bacterium]
MIEAFDTFWSDIDSELQSLPMAADVQPLPIRSSATFSGYSVRLTSVGPYRIFGYLSVPRQTPAPGLLLTPRYGSVNHVPDFHDRERYVVLQLVHRGQRLADQPFAAEYPGLLTLGIADPMTYIYRGIVADCLRGAEFLFSRPELDTSRVAIQGDDLALITAARRPSFSDAMIADPLLYRLLDRAQHSDAYPTEELNDYLRAQPDQRNSVSHTLEFFDASRHAPRVTAHTLLIDPDPDLRDAFNVPVEEYVRTHRGAVDHTAIDAWLAGRLGAEPRAQFLQEVL